ncbi:MAG: hypothetical protein M3R13_08215 [Armatimonadota bacterium]|nr:hypothetical protein [Armatimonadota bacterium]
MKQTIYASFADIEMAEKATGALLDFGMRDEDISLVANEKHLNRVPAVSEVAVNDDYNTIAVDRNAPVYEREDLGAKAGISTTTGADAGVGAAKGAGVGLGVGVLAGLASLAIPGFGLVLGGGALATALAGAAGATAAGAVAGGVTGYLKDQGMPEHAAEAYKEDFERGGAVLAVTAPSNDVGVATAEDLLDKYGATNISAY